LSIYYLHSNPGDPFDLEAISQLLNNFDHAGRDPVSQTGFIVTESRNHTEEVQKARRLDPNEPHWVVFMDVKPDCIFLQMEATVDVLKAFKPVLQSLSNLCHVVRVSDDRGNKSLVPPKGDWVAYLLD
jgi:hypothetical protein